MIGIKYSYLIQGGEVIFIEYNRLFMNVCCKYLDNLLKCFV